MKTLKDLERPLHIHNLELLLKEDLVKNNDALFETINFAIEKLRIPTADEVREALSDYLDCDVVFDGKDFKIKKYIFLDEPTYDWQRINLNELLDDKRYDLLILVARFYEGVIE